MKLSTQVLVPGIEDEQTLSVEVEGNVATFTLAGKEIFMTDYEENLEEFMIAIMKLWGHATETVIQDKNTEGKKHE